MESLGINLLPLSRPWLCRPRLTTKRQNRRRNACITWCHRGQSDMISLFSTMGEDNTNAAPPLYRRTEEDTCGDIIITEERSGGAGGGQRRRRRGKIALSHKRVTRSGGNGERRRAKGDRLVGSGGGLALCGLLTCVSEGDRDRLRSFPPSLPMSLPFCSDL